MLSVFRLGLLFSLPSFVAAEAWIFLAMAADWHRDAEDTLGCAEA